MQQQMQPMLFGGAAPEATANSTTTADLRVARGPGMRRVSCPPKPQFDLFGREVPKATEAALPVADALMSAPSPHSVAASAEASAVRSRDNAAAPMDVAKRVCTPAHNS